MALPVAELVGLRFSVVHLRLAGYAILAVWLSEIAGLLSAPLLQAVGTRLHYISQALDVSPLLLVGIALIAFQGGLQRSWLERLLLPLLFALLPLLSAIHFLMVPASIANALTLGSKQLEVSRSQLRTIEGQLDRAGQVLLSSQDLEDLQRRLDAIPGVKLRTTPDLSLEQARREVAESLQNERRRVRAQIGVTTAQARDQFTRRAIQNATLASVIGLMLAWLRSSALHELNLSSTYLAWVLASEAGATRSEGLKELLEFQKTCLATSYLALLERLTRLTSPARRKEEEERERQMEKDLLERLQLPQQEPPVAPWEPRTASLQSEDWRRRAGIFRGEAGSEPLLDADAPEEQDALLEPRLTPRELRRQQRDRERVRIAMEQFARMVSDYEPADAGYGSEASRRSGPSQRQLRLAREALERFAQQFEQDLAVSDELEPGVHPMGFEDPDASPAPPTAAGAGVPAAEATSGTAQQAPEPGGEGQPTLRPSGPPPISAPSPQPLRSGGHPLRRLVDWLITHL